MIKYVKASSTDSLYVQFVHESELVVPDLNSVTYSIYDNIMDVVNSRTDISVTTDASTTSINIPLSSDDNQKTRSVELRYVKVNWSLNGVSMSELLSYQLVDRVLFPVSFSDVRSTVGLDQTEMPDEVIDIVKAYQGIVREISTFDTILNSGETSTLDAIEAIKYKAALNAIHPIELMAQMRVQADNISTSRFERIDFDNLRKRLSGRYSNLIRILKENTIGDPTLAIAAVGTDAVTGG